MGKASSAKKVARAQRAGQAGGSAGKERRDIGFPVAVALVCVLGTLLVVLAHTSRDVSADEPTLNDHWHNPYGVYDCQSDSYLAPFTGSLDPLGIHSHQDGLIHIHPFSSSVTGNGAELDIFLDAMQADLNDDELVMPDGTILAAGTDCGGEEAVMQVWRWNALDIEAGPIEIITENLSDITFEADAQAFTIALAPLGADLEAPPSIGTQPTDLDAGDPVNIEDLAGLDTSSDTGTSSDAGTSSDTGTSSSDADTSSSDVPETTVG